MNQHLFKHFHWAFLPLLAACVQTEVIPEYPEPKLTLETTAVSLKADEGFQLNASYTNESGENQPNLIQWHSAAPAIAQVTGVGYVTALSAGQTWVIVSAPGNLRDSVFVTVTENDNDVAAVVIQSAPTTLTVGESVLLKARAYNAVNQEIGGISFSWTSSDTAVLGISPDGRITARNPGNASIRAGVSGISSLPAVIGVLPSEGASRSGTFSGNTGYSVKGTATLEQTPTALILTLGSDFTSSNGPMLGVYLAKTASGGLNAQNSLKLANLNANSGAQTYAVPAGVGLHDYDYAVIYCIPFNVRFGTAKLDN